MKQTRSKLTTIILGFVISILVISIFFISFMIQGDTESSPATPKITKAASITYSKILALNKSNNNSNNISDTPTTTPIISPTILILSPTLEINQAESPTPTEIILAYNNVSPTQISTNSSTITPTKAIILPETGFITNGLIIFFTASIIIFFSFLF